MVTAVIFDLDGVIVDSEPRWERVRRDVVDEHGGHWADDAQQRLMGMNTQQWAAYLSRDLGVRLTPDEVASLVIERMAASYSEELPVMPGAVDAVRRTAQHWPLGLASSSPAALIRTVLDRAGLAGLFSVTTSTEEVERGKPDPAVYRAVAERLGAVPHECVAVEDSSNGVRSASAAGIPTIAIPHPRYPLDPEARALARVVLSSPADLTPEVVAGLA